MQPGSHVGMQASIQACRVQAGRQTSRHELHADRKSGRQEVRQEVSQAVRKSGSQAGRKAGGQSRQKAKLHSLQKADGQAGKDAAKPTVSFKI
jgi:hypothetical protein